MKNWEDLLKTCAECLATCKSCAYEGWAKLEHSKDERACLRMWTDCATVCEAVIHLVGRGSAYSEDMVRLCGKMCDDLYRECSKHHTASCSRCAHIAKRCSEACHRFKYEGRRAA